jgi:hypothetical protein
MLTPSIPVIQFPKWPDIILDLHNIRIGMKIIMPDFKFTKRPILLPNIPELHLPDVPDLSISINIPSLPILPQLSM